MSCRTVVITEIISPYRIPVFNALARDPEIDLHVIFLAETDPTQRQWLVHKEDIQFSFEVLPSWRRRIHGRNVLLNWGVDAALEAASPETIICGGYNYFASWSALHWARRRGVRFLLWIESTAHDFRSGSVVTESLKKQFMGQCDGFIVPGKSSREYLRAYSIDDDQIVLARNAVDNDFFASAADKARQNAEMNRELHSLPDQYLLFVGRLVPDKGVIDLIEAYEMLSVELRTQVGLVFVGAGITEAELRKRASSITPGSIHFAGFRQRDELAIFYALAQALVLPTYTDRWGLVVNEAMACGVPVICSSAAGCAADLIPDCRNGYVIEPRDVRGLASALTNLLQDSPLRAEMGESVRNYIKRYSPEICAAGMAKASVGSHATQDA
ncbi:MAG TPA: glycosyltransferase family 4 protein [Terriglobales bacterium]|nr:glycosyltransferase family 4 protein [Terriglobales bacterium]